MRAHREGSEVVLHPTRRDLELLSLVCRECAFEALPDRVFQEIERLGKALAKLEQGEEVRE